MTEQTTLQDKMLALCEMKTECPCNGRQLHPSKDLSSGTWCETGHHSERCGCKGTGKVYLLDPDGKFGLRVRCGHQYCAAKGFCTLGLRHGNPLHDCQGRGWTATTDLATWMEMAAGLNIIVNIRNDGPGWRCDLRENRIVGASLAMGWSDGGFTLAEPPKYKPYPLEAVVNGLQELLKLNLGQRW